MNHIPPGHRFIRFGIYECDLRAGELHKSGRKVKLSDQPFRLLTLLLERRGELVTRQELRERLWPAEEFGEFDDGLNTAINKVRAALDDSAENPRFVETVPRRGYRFIAPVEIETDTAHQPPVVASVPDESTLHTEPPPAERVSHNGYLRRIAGGVAAVALIGLAGAYVWWHLHARVTAAAEMPIRSIAVLPFDNFSGNPGQDYFAEGMTDELTTDLAQVGSLRVTSRASAMAYHGAQKSMSQIRRELGVDAVVEGSVVRSGKNVRVDAQLVETSDDRQIWAQSFMRSEQDIIVLQDDIAQAVAERVEVALDPSVRERLADARPVNADAYEAYLHGTEHLADHSDADLLKSLDYFKQAVALDPTFAQAYAGEAEAYCYLGDYDVLPDKVVWPKAEMAAQRALDLNSSLSQAHAAKALTLWRYEWKWTEAQAEFRRALQLNPNDADTHHVYGIFLATRGDFPDAERQLETARELDPLSQIIRTNIGWLSYFQHDYAKSIAQYERVIETDPRFYPAHVKLWWSYALAGDQRRAGNELDHVFRDWGEAGLADRVALQVNAVPQPRRFRTEVLGYANSGYLTNFEKARYLAFAGETAEALKALEQAQAARDSWLVYAGIEPAFDSLHSSPRFQRVLDAVGLSSPHANQ